jgi:hypothetical protein
MSWQDDLGELDRALADGRIPADDHRRRRNEILAASADAGSTAAAPVQPGDPADEPTTRRIPFAPPFRWTGTGPDTTQPGGSADATQVVDTGSPHPARSDRQPAAWPWPDEPDTITPPNPAWLVRGPDVFPTEPPSRARIAAIASVALVVVGLVVGGFVVFGHSAGGRGVTRQPDELAIAALPGAPADHSGIATFEDAAREHFLTPQEIGWYRDAGAGPARLATSTTPAGVRVLVLTVRTSSPSEAAAARDELAEQQVRFGMTGSAAPPGVRVAELARSATVPAVIRAHYVHDDTVVRVQVDGDDMTAVRAVFQDVLRAQSLALAPRG